MPSVQQSKVDELRREVMHLRAKLDAAEGEVYAFGRRFGLGYHEVRYMRNVEAQVLIQEADDARDRWFAKNEEHREALWYLHHAPGTFVP